MTWLTSKTTLAILFSKMYLKMSIYYKGMNGLKVYSTTQDDISNENEKDLPEALTFTTWTTTTIKSMPFLLVSLTIKLEEEILFSGNSVM